MWFYIYLVGTMDGRGGGGGGCCNTLVCSVLIECMAFIFTFIVYVTTCSCPGQSGLRAYKKAW